jgi:hypothetical protein
MWTVSLACVIGRCCDNICPRCESVRIEHCVSRHYLQSLIHRSIHTRDLQIQLYFISINSHTFASFRRFSAIMVILVYERNKKETPCLESGSELYRLSDRRMSAKLVPTFADRECHVVSVTDPYGRILRFIDWSRYLLFSSSSTVVLTRLSGPRSRPTNSHVCMCVLSRAKARHACGNHYAEILVTLREVAKVRCTVSYIVI